MNEYRNLASLALLFGLVFMHGHTAPQTLELITICSDIEAYPEVPSFVKDIVCQQINEQKGAARTQAPSDNGLQFTDSNAQSIVNNDENVVNVTGNAPNPTVQSTASQDDSSKLTETASVTDFTDILLINPNQEETVSSLDYTNDPTVGNYSDVDFEANVSDLLLSIYGYQIPEQQNQSFSGQWTELSSQPETVQLLPQSALEFDNYGHLQKTEVAGTDNLEVSDRNVNLINGQNSSGVLNDTFFLLENGNNTSSVSTGKRGDQSPDSHQNDNNNNEVVDEAAGQQQKTGGSNGFETQSGQKQGSYAANIEIAANYTDFNDNATTGDPTINQQPEASVSPQQSPSVPIHEDVNITLPEYNKISSEFPSGSFTPTSVPDNSPNREQQGNYSVANRQENEVLQNEEHFGLNLTSKVTEEQEGRQYSTVLADGQTSFVQTGSQTSSQLEETVTTDIQPPTNTHLTPAVTEVPAYSRQSSTTNQSFVTTMATSSTARVSDAGEDNGSSNILIQSSTPLIVEVTWKPNDAEENSAPKETSTADTVSPTSNVAESQQGGDFQQNSGPIQASNPQTASNETTSIPEGKQDAVESNVEQQTTSLTPSIAAEEPNDLGQDSSIDGKPNTMHTENSVSTVPAGTQGSSATNVGAEISTESTSRMQSTETVVSENEQRSTQLHSSSALAAEVTTIQNDLQQSTASGKTSISDETITLTPGVSKDEQYDSTPNAQHQPSNQWTLGSTEVPTENNISSSIEPPADTSRITSEDEQGTATPNVTSQSNTQLTSGVTETSTEQDRSTVQINTQASTIQIATQKPNVSEEPVQESGLEADDNNTHDPKSILGELITALINYLQDTNLYGSYENIEDIITGIGRNLTETNFSRELTFHDILESIPSTVDTFRLNGTDWKQVVNNINAITSRRRWNALVDALLKTYGGGVFNRLRFYHASKVVREAARTSVASPECRWVGANPLQAGDNCSSKFYLCSHWGWQWRSRKVDCPRDFLFSSSLRRCLWHPLSDCDDSSSDSSDDSSEEWGNPRRFHVKQH